jgi:hypothetical protein
LYCGASVLIDLGYVVAVDSPVVELIPYDGLDSLRQKASHRFDICRLVITCAAVLRGGLN